MKIVLVCGIIIDIKSHINFYKDIWIFNSLFSFFVKFKESSDDSSELFDWI